MSCQTILRSWVDQGIAAASPQYRVTRGLTVKPVELELHEHVRKNKKDNEKPYVNETSCVGQKNWGKRREQSNNPVRKEGHSDIWPRTGFPKNYCKSAFRGFDPRERRFYRPIRSSFWMCRNLSGGREISMLTCWTAVQIGRLERVNVMRIVRSTLASNTRDPMWPTQSLANGLQNLRFEKAKASHILNLSRSGFFSRANGN